MALAESAVVALARAALERFVTEGDRLEVLYPVPDDLANPAACFVSLHIGDALRGCMGTIEPSESCLAEEVISNAISAGSRDPRFPPVSAVELGSLSYSVDVLEPPERIWTLSGHDPKTYGLIVESARDLRRGLLLPDLEGIKTAEHQMSVCRAKAGIGSGEDVRLYRFRVSRHH